MKKEIESVNEETLTIDGVGVFGISDPAETEIQAECEKLWHENQSGEFKDAFKNVADKVRKTAIRHLKEVEAARRGV